MNYAEINQAILENRDVDESIIEKNDSFYIYLKNNKVAYYYSKFLSKRRTSQEVDIIEKGNKLNERFFESVNSIREICLSNNIRFLLYKTCKFIPEVVDGDIDMFIKPGYWHKFHAIYSKLGYTVRYDESGKSKVILPHLCTMEPHQNISWRGGNYLSEKFIWENTGLCTSMGVETASIEVELSGLFAKVFFEPQYLDLYSLKLIKLFRQTA